MKKKLKKLQDQVIVITGASSGIGLVTARMAARKGPVTFMPGRMGNIDRVSLFPCMEGRET